MPTQNHSVDSLIGGGMEGYAFWIAAIAAASFVGLSKGGLSSMGTISVPILALVIDPIVAAGLLLPVYVISDVFGVYTYRHKFNWPVLKITVIGGTVGIVIGALLATVVPSAAVTMLVGLIGAAFVVNFLFFQDEPVPPEPLKVKKGLFWTTVAGFTSFVSHAGAPPFKLFVLPLKLDKLAFAGTATLAFAYINAAKLVPYALLGQINLVSLKVAAILMGPAVISVFIGAKLVKVIPDKLFFNFVVVTLGLVSVKLIWDALGQLGVI